MKIEFISRSTEEMEEYDCRDAVEIKIDGESVFSVSDGEPEDSNLGRDFNDVYKIPTLLKMVHKAGLAGEKLEMVDI